MGVFRNENAAAHSSRDTQQQEKCSRAFLLWAVLREAGVLTEKQSTTSLNFGLKMWVDAALSK